MDQKTIDIAASGAKRIMAHDSGEWFAAQCLARYTLELIAEVERLRAGLFMIADGRAPSALKGIYGGTLYVAAVVLVGADVREPATLQAIAAGTWKTNGG